MHIDWAIPELDVGVGLTMEHGLNAYQGYICQNNTIVLEIF